MTDDPYHDGGTRGSSGGGASADAALADLVKGVTNAAQKYVVIMAQQAGERGVTVAELRDKTGNLHHGRVSSATTKMHIAGKLVRLEQRRGHSHIYVTPEFVADRVERPYRQQNHRLTVEDVTTILNEHGYLRHLGQLDGRAACECGEVSIHSRADHRRHVARVIVAASRGEQRGTA